MFFERSEQAIVELSDTYGALCNRIAQNILHDKSDAEECVNDTYLSLWNTIPPHRPDPLKAYVCKVVRNIAVKKYHSNTAAKRNSTYDVSLDELENCLVGMCDTEEACSVQLLSQAIETFLDTLDRDNRVIFIRRYWFADSIDDIARRMSMSAPRVTARLFRTRQKLRHYLQKEGFTV